MCVCVCVWGGGGGGVVKFCACESSVNWRRSLLLIQSTWVICLDCMDFLKSDRKDRFWQIVMFHYEYLD